MRLNATLLASLLLAAAACSGSSKPPPVSQTPDAGQPDAGQPDAGQPDAGPADPVKTGANETIDEGRETFRFDTFGDEAFWGDTIHLHQAIGGTNNAVGGVGAGVSPATALGVGLKVDVDALPQSVKDALAAKTIDLNNPATTVALLSLNAVVGVKGIVDANSKLTGMGVTCALCHSTVDDSFAPGIGHRLDGWANRDLNVGAIIDLAPDLTVVQNLLGVDRPTLDTVLKTWGPGKFDAEVFLDGKATNGTASAAVLIPPAFGLLGVNMHTWTGWGSITYWNAFVAVLEMHGKGNFFDSRLDNTTTFPVAAANHFGHVQVPLADDQVTSKLAALQFYQLAIKAPTPPSGSFDAAAATRGQAVFNGAGKCASCHVPPLFTEPGWNMHDPADVGLTTPADQFQAGRSPDKKYRTSPLKGLFSHSKGGFYHDGRFADLAGVVSHYNDTGALGLSTAQQADLVEYLKSL